MYVYFRKKFEWKKLCLDGLVCSGKTSVCRELANELPVMCNDYKQRFKDKWKILKMYLDLPTQLLATCSQNIDLQTAKHVIMDTSPLSDIWINYVFAIKCKYKTLADFTTFINTDYAKDICSYFPSFFVVIDKLDYEAFDDILNMTEDNDYYINGERMSYNFLNIHLDLLYEIKKANIPNFYFFNKPKYVPMYTESCQNLLKNQLVKSFLMIESKNKFNFSK